mgnify:FL=1
MADLLTDNNCLNLVRIIAAFQVMLGHLLEHLELQGNETLFRITYFLRGVPIFFVISGYLIWISAARSKSFAQYLKKRFWRIYPELWMAVIIEIIVLVILYHSWNIKQLVLFGFGQGTVLQFWTPECLRGYGVGTPNGALWTIGVMVQFYIIVWFFYGRIKNQKIIIWCAGFAVSFAVSWGGGYITRELIGKEIIGKIYDQTFIKYFWIFYIGMFIARFQDRIIPILQRYWHVLLAAAFFFFWTGWDLFSGYYLLWSLFMASGVIGFAYRFPQLSISLDFSYGLFLYHMTVVNVFVNFGWTGSWLYVIPVMLISSLFACLSALTAGRTSAVRKHQIIQNDYTGGKK